MHYVYCHENTINGKKYIGLTCNPKNRWRSPQHRYARCTAFGNAIKKYGWDNFTHTILCECEDRKEAATKEQYYIAIYNTLDHDYGYNLTAGGEGTLGMKMPEYARKHLSEIHMGEKNPMYHKEITEEHRQNLKKALKGLKKSESARKNMSKAQRGKVMPEGSAEKRLNTIRERYGENYGLRPTVPVVCVETGIEYESGKQAQEITGISRHNICSCCKGERKTAGGYHWIYLEVEEGGDAIA